ncbi:MAG TPA: hypothetical protein VFA73_05605 [Actinomycetota bacterium]|nr:hypothetical protein [Actinomycetota bacterium]
MLLVGSVAAADVPELGEPETRDEVRRRLGEAGCELVYSPASERWLARLDGPVPELEGHDPVLALGTAELAVLATCWLHLRFLPGERAVQPPSPGAPLRGSPGPSGEAWVDPDDLAELLGARLNGTGLPSVLERLARAGYLTLREGRVEAGPLLDTLDEPGAADQARGLVARHQRLAHLRRRAAELDGVEQDAVEQDRGEQDVAQD